MKKLMIAACAIAFAAVSQAATFNWEYDADGEVGSDDNTYYFFTGNTGIGSQIATILSDEGVDAFKEALKTASYNTGSFEDGGYFYEDTFAGDVAGNAGAIFVLDSTLDAGKGFSYLDVDLTDYTYAPPSGSPGTLSIYGSDAGFSSGTIADVPEPTSAMLLLLGVAGLALKRRRA